MSVTTPQSIYTDISNKKINTLRRKIELWDTGVSKLPLNEYLGVSKEELAELLKRLGR